MEFLLCLATKVRHAHNSDEPMMLHMGWIESPPYFCTVSETGRYVAEQYIDTPVVSLALHKFVKFKEVNPEFLELPKAYISDYPFNYMLEVYMDDCRSGVILHVELSH